jgi:hypothetical protein
METNSTHSQESQPRRRAIIEIDEDGELHIFPIAHNDADEQGILDALRFVMAAARNGKLALHLTEEQAAG